MNKFKLLIDTVDPLCALKLSNKVLQTEYLVLLYEKKERFVFVHSKRHIQTTTTKPHINFRVVRWRYHDDATDDDGAFVAVCVMHSRARNVLFLQNVQTSTWAAMGLLLRQRQRPMCLAHFLSVAHNTYIYTYILYT